MVWRLEKTSGPSTSGVLRKDEMTVDSPEHEPGVAGITLDPIPAGTFRVWRRSVAPRACNCGDRSRGGALLAAVGAGDEL